MGRLIPIKCFIFLTFVICCKCQSINSPDASSSCAKLQISPDIFSSMEYGNFLIEIYEHANNQKTLTANQKKYFYSPLALLDHNSAVSLYNNVTNQSEMRFRIEMWSDKVQNEIVKHLNEITGHEIKSNQVRVMPLEKVILTSNIPTEDYSLSSVWTNYDKSKLLKLSLSCFDQKICEKLANEMRSNPEQFDHLKLLYSLLSQASQTKLSTISIDSVTSGSMVSKLLQKFENKNEIFLTANDEKKMLTETAANIRMETFDDFEVASPDTENQIVNILKDFLITSRTTIKEQNDKMWDSVVWNDDNYRPDKTTKTLNEIIDKLDKETQKKLADLFEKMERQSEMKLNLDENKNEEKIQHNYDANSWTQLDKISSTISGKLANDSDSSSRVEILKEDVGKLLRESRNHVQWDGEKFVPKPMQLSQINLVKFRDSQSFQDRNLRVCYTNAELSAPLRFMEHAELTVTDEWNNLKEQLKEAVIKLEKMNNELTQVKRDFTNKLEATSEVLMKTNGELNNVKRDLTNKLEGTRQELENTKTEFQKTKAGLSKTVDNLSKKLNATEKELAETKITVTNLSTEIKNCVMNIQRVGREIKVAEGNVKKDLKEISNNLETATKNLTSTMTELSRTKSAVADLTKMLNMNIQRLGYEIKVAEGNGKKDLKETSNHLETATRNLTSTMTELSRTKSAVADLTKMLNDRTSEIVDIGQMPTSCFDLQRMGHKLSGFFSVKGSKQMEMIFCDFYPNRNDKQKWIGYADVRSAAVHFYVQRNSSTFNTTSTPIPFDLAQVNKGNAMNLTSGIFTAPQTGFYFFSFTGLAGLPASSSWVYLKVSLYLNGGLVGTVRAGDANTVANQFSPMSTLQSAMTLKKGDQVWVEITGMSSGAYLFDYNHYTHFMGFMLDEEIVASL